MSLGTLGRQELRQVSRLHRRRAPGWERPRARAAVTPVVVGATVIGLVTLVLRLVFGANGPTDWDGSQYIVGSQHFDVAHGAPQPPGYFLYVEAGRALHAVTGLGAAPSLVLVAALVSAAAAALTCEAGAALGGMWVGMAAGAVVASAPVSWFAGSTVSTYSFDALAGALLMLLASGARPHSAHGIGAVVTLGLLTGFRPSILPMFVLLTLIPVAASTRSLRQLWVTAAAGAAALAVWFVPMVLIQTGGVREWFHAWHAEAVGAAQTSSVFSNPAGAATNFGSFSAYTVLTLGPLAVPAVVALVALIVTRAATGRSAGDATLRIWQSGSGASESPARLGKPWYQTTPAIVAAAAVPPLAIVNLVQFAKGGYVLSYLPALAVLLLLPLGRLVRHRIRGIRRVSAVIASLAVLAVVGVNGQRFVSAPGILPASFASSHPGIWISQVRYGAPYTDTATTIRRADAAVASLRALGGVVDSPSDVVVTRFEDDGATYFRAITYALPGVRAALVIGSTVVYQELGGPLYYDNRSSVAVAPGGHAVFLLPAPTPELLALVHAGRAQPTGVRAAGLAAWRVEPGTTLFGVSIVARPGRQPLGHGV